MFAISGRWSERHRFEGDTGDGPGETESLGGKVTFEKLSLPESGYASPGMNISNMQLW